MIFEDNSTGRRSLQERIIIVNDKDEISINPKIKSFVDEYFLRRRPPNKYGHGICASMVLFDEVGAVKINENDGEEEHALTFQNIGEILENQPLSSECIDDYSYKYNIANIRNCNTVIHFEETNDTLKVYVFCPEKCLLPFHTKVLLSLFDSFEKYQNDFRVSYLGISFGNVSKGEADEYMVRSVEEIKNIIMEYSSEKVFDDTSEKST